VPASLGYDAAGMAGYIDTYYARTLAEPGDRAPLDGTIEAETCVVGGGLAGLATALDLAERGRSVVVLERHRVGWGASGRNGGFASAGFPNGLPALVDRVGLDAARELYAMSRDAQALLRERIARYDIDCGPVEEGALRCALAGSNESLEQYCDDFARDFGVQMQYWPAARVREVLATARYGDAFFNPTTFRLHPLNLARGLARALEGAGGRVFEQTPAEALALAGQKSVRTPSGRVRCENIVLAGGGYIGGLYWPVSMATIPIATFVLVTEPLGDLLHQTIGVPYAISDIKTATNYYRPLADGRLLWGGRVLAWEPSVEHIGRVLRRDMVSFYPGLADARVEVAWGGLMPYLRHKLPVIGKLADGLWVATGFGGLGLVLTTLAGRLIGAGMTEGDDRWRQFEGFGLPFAGGKLGRVPAQFVYWRHQAENWLGRHKRA